MSFLDWNQFLSWLAPLAGLALCGLGMLAIFSPLLGAKAFGLPASKEGLPFVPVLGARDVALGLALLGVCARGERHSVAMLILSLVVVAVADGLVVFRHGDRRVVPIHLAGAVGAAAYGAWLWAGH